MGIQVLAMEGVLDVATTVDARETLTTAVERAAPLVLELRGLRAADEAGVVALGSALRRARDAGLPVAVVRPAASTASRLVEDARPDEQTRLVESLSAAIEAVSPAWTGASTRWTPQPSVQIRPRGD
jgi:anti-anti-sigma regulatory factor